MPTTPPIGRVRRVAIAAAVALVFAALAGQLWPSAEKSAAADTPPPELQLAVATTSAVSAPTSAQAPVGKATVPSKRPAAAPSPVTRAPPKAVAAALAHVADDVAGQLKGWTLPRSKWADTRSYGRLAIDAPIIVPPRLKMPSMRLSGGDAESPSKAAGGTPSSGELLEAMVPWGGRIIAANGASPLGELLEGPISAMCAASAHAFHLDPIDFAASPVAPKRELLEGWPWAWWKSKKFDVRVACGWSAQKRLPGLLDMAQYTKQRPLWAKHPHVEPERRRVWLLHNVTVFRERYYVAPATIAAVARDCGETKEGDDPDPKLPAYCTSVRVVQQGGVQKVLVFFGGYVPFVYGRWPPTVSDWLLLEPLGAAHAGSTERRVVQEAVWAPPVDLKFSYHLIAEFFMPLFRTVRHRVERGLQTPIVMERPRTTRFGFEAWSCHFGAKVCLDDAATPANGTQKPVPQEYHRLLYRLAGGRENVLGLDGTDMRGQRSVLAKRLLAGQFPHCDTGQGRSAVALLNAPQFLATPAHADCGRAWWAFREFNKQHLASEGRLDEDVRQARSDEVATVEPAKVVYVQRQGTMRRLLGDNEMVAALRQAASRGKFGPGATVEVVHVDSLADAFNHFARATVVVVTHGAVMVNVPFLRINAGLVAIDTEAPAMLPMLPSWIHVEMARAKCKAVGQFRCHDASTFHDFELPREAIAHIVDAVRAITAKQRRGKAARL